MEIQAAICIGNGIVHALLDSLAGAQRTVVVTTEVPIAKATTTAWAVVGRGALPIRGGAGPGVELVEDRFSVFISFFVIESAVDGVAVAGVGYGGGCLADSAGGAGGTGGVGDGGGDGTGCFGAPC